MWDRIENGYTLVQKRVTTFPDKEPVIDSVITRYRASDGNFVEVKETGGKQFLAFSRDGKYLRLQKDKSGSHLIQVGSHDAKRRTFNEEDLLRSPTLRKDQPIEWVVGVKCYVTHIEDDEASMDIYFAPSLATVLQIIRKHKPTNVIQTLKPVTLVFGEPDRKIFEDLPVNLPVESLPLRHKK